MSLLAIGGLLFAAILHALWNFLLKTSTDKQVYTLMSLGIASALLLPVALLSDWAISAIGWGLIGLSALCEVVYFLLLGGAYAGGQLSLMYPISRGSTPLFTTLIAVVFIGERVSGLGLLGIALVVAGIYVLHLRNFRRDGLLEPFAALRERASRFALLSGLAVAGYSTADKVGVAHVDPPVYLFLVFGLTVMLLAPHLLLHKRDAMRAEWRNGRRSILLTGAMIAGGYLLILFILTTNKVSYATSVRGVSVVFGALLGTLVLKEGLGDKKMFGALLIFAGIMCIGLAQ